jgi:hypothetical protein
MSLTFFAVAPLFVPMVLLAGFFDGHADVDGLDLCLCDDVCVVLDGDVDADSV